MLIVVYFSCIIYPDKDYIYFGEIKMKKDLTVPLLSVCSKLEIDGLINHILGGVLFTSSKEVEVKSSADNVHFSIIGMLEYFRKKDENRTVHDIINFLTKNFKHLRQQSNLGNLSGNFINTGRHFSDYTC